MTFRKLHIVLATVVIVTMSTFSACSEKSNGTQANFESPSLQAQKKYDNKIVRQPPANRGKDDGWYLVKGGQRRWIVDAVWLERNGYQAATVIEISSAEFNAIPEDPAPLK